MHSFTKDANNRLFVSFFIFYSNYRNGEVKLSLSAKNNILDIEDLKINKLIEIPKTTSNNDAEILRLFKKLKTNIQFLNVNNKNAKSLYVTSSYKQEGKSFVTSNLAISYAEIGKKVLIIDSDLKNGKISKIFNIPNNLGFSNLLSGLDDEGNDIDDNINKFIKDTEIKNLSIITSGTVPPNPSELIASPKIPKILKQLAKIFDVIIIDGTSTLITDEALILSRLCGSTIFVLDYDNTNKNEIYQAKEDIENVGGNIIGVVINKTHPREKRKLLRGFFNIIISFMKKIIYNIKRSISIRKIKLLEAGKFDNNYNRKDIIFDKKVDKTEKKIEINQNKEIKEINNSKNDNSIIDEKSNDKDNEEANTDKQFKSEETINIVKAELENKTENKIENYNENRIIKSSSKTEKNIENINNSTENNNLKIESIFPNENNKKESTEKTFHESKSIIIEDNVIDKTNEILSIGENVKNKNDNEEKNNSKDSIIVKPAIVLKNLRNKFVKNKYEDASKNISENILIDDFENEPQNISFNTSESKFSDSPDNLLEESNIRKEQNDYIIDTNYNIKNDYKNDSNNNNHEYNHTNNLVVNNNIEKKNYLNDNTDSNKQEKLNIIIDDDARIDDNSISVIVDAERGMCIAFNRYCYVEKYIRGLDKKDGFQKEYYSLKLKNKRIKGLMNIYNISKKQASKVDPLIYETLSDLDENIWLQEKKEENIADNYVKCLTKEYERLPNESNKRFNAKCQNLRYENLRLMGIEIDYKINIRSHSNNISFTDKIEMINYAKFIKSSNSEDIKKNNTSDENIQLYNNKSFFGSVKKRSLFDNNKEPQREIEREKKKEIEVLKKVRKERNEVKRKKIRDEKEKKAEEKRRIREENKKQKELERIKQREEARIEEELLEDNLYPKTKNNKYL